MSRGLGDVYKRQVEDGDALVVVEAAAPAETPQPIVDFVVAREEPDRDDAPSPKA